MGGNQGLISFLLFPGKVTGMVVLDQPLPFALRLAMTRRFAATTFPPLGSCFSFAVYVGAGIDRINEHRVKRCVSGQFPNHLPFAKPMRKGGQQNVLFSKPSEHLANAAQFGHVTKYQLPGLLHTLVGIFFQFPAGRPTESDRNLNLQFATASFLKNGFGRPLPEQVHLKFTDGTFVGVKCR